MASYHVVVVKLDAAQDRVLLDRTENISVKAIAILALSTGAALSLHFGNDVEAVPLTAPISFEFDTPELKGIRVTNTAQVGLTATLLISYSDNPVREVAV